MRIPRSLISKVTNLQKVALQKMQEEIDKEEARKKIEQQEKEELVRRGLPCAEKIFAWALEFQKNKAGQKLIEVGNIYGTMDGVCFFDGHVEGEAWRALGIGSRGLYWHPAGCGAHEYYVSTPRQLAEEVDPEILELACSWIQGKAKKALDCINRRLERKT